MSIVPHGVRSRHVGQVAGRGSHRDGAWSPSADLADSAAEVITQGSVPLEQTTTQGIAPGTVLTGGFQNMPNSVTATVVADADGLHINDGALFLEDEYGETVLVASGFSGSWNDFLGTGVYNGILAAGAAGGLVAGRTASLPYWTVTMVDASGAATFTRTADGNFPGGFSVRFTPGGTSDLLKLVSDRVPVVALERYLVGVIGAYNLGGTADFMFTLQVFWYDAAGVLISGGSLQQSRIVGAGHQWAPGFSSNLAAPSIVKVSDISFVGGLTAPAAARMADIRLTVQETTAHSASSMFYLGGMSLGVDDRRNDSSFPTLPVFEQRWYRTDLDLEFYWDGARWLSTQTFTSQLRWVATANSQSWSATVVNALSGNVPSLQGGSDVWMVSHLTAFTVGAGTALGALHKWVGTFRSVACAGAETALATVSIDSGASSVYRSDEQAIGALMNAGTLKFVFLETWTKTGTPGNLQAFTEITYRIVAT